MTLLAIAIASSRRAAPNLVKAFSTCAGRVSLAEKSSNLNHLKSTNLSKQRFSTQVEATKPELDLDSALDEILGSAFKEAGDATPKSSSASTSPSKSKDQKGEADFTDAKFLSTSNPYWTSVGMSQAVIDVLSSKGITRFTEVQAKAFEPVLAGRDMIGRSRTGTGKTLAFGIPSIHRIVKLAEERGQVDEYGRRKRGRGVSMIVLCPTRELARQVEEELSLVAKPLGLFTTCFHGGVSYDPQARALKNGVDILVGTPGRIMDHLERKNLDLSECDIAILDEADEMLNMGFAEDVEVILEGIGSKNEEKTQCLLFSATTPPWVKEIGRNYQSDVVSVDATTDNAARTATTVRHMAIQVPPGPDSKKSILEDIIAVEISKDIDLCAIGASEEDLNDNPIAAAANAKKNKGTGAMQQKIFGKTIVFTETKREADELVSGGVFKTLSAQALHGDVGQKQRDATLNAFRAGAFNVLVATDVAARGIDIKDVDLVIQYSPPREVDTYVHRSGRTGRAGAKGISVLLFDPRQARDIVRIERSVGHGFKFELAGPPSPEAAMTAASKTSALACQTVPAETAEYFKDSAAELLATGESPEDIIAKCLAAISRRANKIQSRSLLTGEEGFLTIEMSNSRGRNVTPGDVMYTISKLSRMSRENDEDSGFESDVGKIQINPQSGTASFDMDADDARKLVEFSEGVDAGGAVFTILTELTVDRGRDFGMAYDRGGRGGGGRGRGGDRFSGRGGGRFSGRGGGRGDFNRPYDGNTRGRGGSGSSYHRREDIRSFSGGRGRGAPPSNDSW